VNRAASFSAIIAFALLLSLAGCKYEIGLDGGPEREVFAQQVGQLLASGQVDNLEKMGDYLRTSKERFSEGIWVLSSFYIGLSKPLDPDNEAQWKDWIEKLERWRSKYPASKTAAIALGEAYFRYGWKARGTGYVDTVTEKGWQLLAERLAKARKILESAAHLPPEDPHWYVAMLSVALGQNWSDAAYDRLYDEAVGKEPTYYDYYFMKANRLLPRWHGHPGDWQRYALNAAGKSPREEGMTLYTRIVWANGEADYGDDVFTKGGIRWPLMKQGFEDIERNYPKSVWNLNAFCYYACMAGDRQTARKLFERIGDRWHLWIWKSRTRFDRSKAWALAGGGETEDKGLSSANPVSSPASLEWEDLWGDMRLNLHLILTTILLYFFISNLLKKIAGRRPKSFEKFCLLIALFTACTGVAFLNKVLPPGPLHNRFLGTIRHALAGQLEKENVPAVVDKAVSSRPDIEGLKKEDPDTFQKLRAVLIESIETHRPTDQIIDGVLQKNSFYALVRKYDPEAYQKDVKTICDAAKAGQSQEQFRQLGEKLAGDLMNKYLSTASDEAILNYSQVKIIAAQQIYAKAPEVGFECFWGGTNHDVNSYLSTNTLKALTSVFGRVIKTAATTPQPPPDKAVMESKFDGLMAEFRKVHGDDVRMLVDEKAASADKKKACELMLAFCKKASDLPPAEASMVFRYLWRSK